jgi:putative peptidoglycan lipid II flippase
MPGRADSLLKSAGVISVLTLLSRGLGLVRDSVCAALFGAGVVWDAFSFAFRVPNMFRMLFGEGAMSAAFVPLFTEYMELRDREDAWRLAGRVASALAMVLLALLIVGEAALVGLLHWLPMSDRWLLALGLTAVILPHMVFVCLTAMAGATLNSLRHFAAPAFAPVVLNVCWIVGVVAVAPWVSSDPQVRIYVVAGAILVAGVLELALQLAVLRKTGFRWRLSLDLRHPDVHKVARTIAPVTLAMAALQVNLVVDGVMAISLSAPPGHDTFTLFGVVVPYPMQIGANSVLYYANRLMQLPLAVFGIAIATATLPALSSYAARQDWRGFSDSFKQSLGAVIFIGVPAGVGLILLRRPVIELVFQRGAFTPAMTARTARAVFGYSSAIWAYCVLHVLTRAFYSLKQPSTPARVAASMVAINATLNLTLAWPLQEAGLATATALSAVIQVAVLYSILTRRVQITQQGAIVITALKTVIATAAMAVVCTATLRALPEAPAEGALALKLVRACVPAATGAAAYLVAALALGTTELRALVRHLRPEGAGAE